MAEMNVELNVVCWNIMGDNSTGGSKRRQEVLQDNIRKVNEFVPDVIFLQEVPWASYGSIVQNLLEELKKYGLTWSVWEKEDNSNAHTVIVYNKVKLTTCGDSFDIRNLTQRAYAALDAKKKLAIKVFEKYKSDQRLQKAIPEDEEAREISHEFRNKSEIEYFTSCFKRGSQDMDLQGSQTVLRGRVAISAFSVQRNPDQLKFIAVSFHNRKPTSQPDKLLYLLLHFLKELHKLTDCPILLAGDFNMDVNKVHRRDLKHLLEFFKPQVYTPTEHRKDADCIDSIMLLDGTGTFELEPIKAKMIDVSAVLDEGSTDQQQMDIRHKISNHDPLTTTLKRVRKKTPVHNPPISVLSWNVQGKNGTPQFSYQMTAVKNESIEDLIFLQEVSDSLVSLIANNHDIYNCEDNRGSASVDGQQFNAIMYNKTKFKREKHSEYYCKKAQENLRIKLLCIEAYKNKETFQDKIHEHVKSNKEMGDYITHWAQQILCNEHFRQELQFLLNCFPNLPENLHTQFVCRILHTKSQPGSIITVSLHITVDYPERMLTAILYLLKELRQCLPQPSAIPILLAGDFNMDVFSSDREGSRMSIYPLVPYNPQPYEQTKRREGQPRVDYIMLWNDSDYTWRLDEVCPSPISVAPFRDTCTGTNTRIYPELKGRHEDTIRNKVSLHDPLITELKLWQ